MEIFLIRVLQFMLAISLLVLLHEGGHFFFAKLFGVRVDKFYLFFDPSIWKWKGSLFKFKPKNSDTTYGIGWLPLGGYCKISGMIDESFDKEQMAQPEQPWEFRTKPAWQRLLIMIGGVLVNFLLALFIYSMVLFWWGDSYIPTKNMTCGMKFNTEAKALGFQDGDILISADGKDFKDYNGDLFRQLSEAHEVTVIRNGKTETVNLPGDLNMLNMIKSEPRFVEALIPMDIDSIMPGSPAEKCGLSVGDKILSVNGHAIADQNDFKNELGVLKDVMLAAETNADKEKARTATIVFQRAKDNLQPSTLDPQPSTLNPQLSLDTARVLLNADADGNLSLGIMSYKALAAYEPVTIEYGFFESFPAGIMYGWHVLASYVEDLKYVFTAEGAKSLGGFGSLFPATWDWHRFWEMTAFLSIILAFMNILPIPALDGGHVLFLLYEMITRRKPSEDFLIKAEYVGFGLLILLMVVANLNDILRWLGYM